MIHRPRGHARTRCLVWSQQSPLEFFQYGSGRPCARVSRVLTKATSHLIALSLQPKEVGNDNRAEVKNDGFGSKAGIVEHDAGGLGYSRSYPDSGPGLAGARYGSDGPTHEVAARQPAARGMSRDSGVRGTRG